MSSQIVLKVSTQQMKQTADSTRAMLNSLKSDFEEIERSVNRTKQYWEGKAAEHYRTTFEQNKETVSEAIARLNEEIEDLQKMAGVYESAENVNTTYASDLPSDVLS